MDTALRAVKRAARAVLRDELKAMRATAARHRQNSADTLSYVQDELETARQSATRYSNDLGKALAELTEFKRRAAQVNEWALKNRAGDLGAQCCAEYVLQGPRAHVYGSGGSYVNPFDRWQVSPALR